MTTVTLHGGLGRALGEKWEFEIRQPREAIAAVEANTGKLYEYLRAHAETEYRVIVNGQDHGSVQELYLVGEFDSIDIVPVPAGSGGLWQTILGVVLIIVGIVLLGTPGAPASPYLINAGIALTLSGVAQLLAPSPKLGTSNFARTFRPQSEQLANGDDNKKDQKQGSNSYLFSGAINTTSQGNPVQLIYGLMIVGSQTVSLAITSTTVDSSVIGSHKVAPADDDFFDLAVWDRLAADARGDTIPTQRSVQVMRVRDIPAARTLFGLPTVFPVTDPAAGRTIQVGNSRLDRRTIRNYLSICSYLFSKNARGITFNEAVDLYRILELDTLDNLARSTWKQVILALALHFSPDP